MQKQKDYGPALCVLGLIDAALGNKEVALQEGRRAMELLPREKDAINGELSLAILLSSRHGQVKRIWRYSS